MLKTQICVTRPQCVKVVQSTKKCAKQCSPDIRVHKRYVYCIVLRHEKLKPSARNLPHAKNENSQLPMEFVWLWHVK